MIVAEWKNVGVLVGELIASEPPFAQICIALAAAFAFLMIVEGLRASFVMRRSEPVQSKSAPRTIVAPRATASAMPHRITASPTHNPKLRTRAIKPHSAPRPIIQRRTLHASEPQAEVLTRTRVPQVASFEE